MSNRKGGSRENKFNATIRFCFQNVDRDQWEITYADVLAIRQVQQLSIETYSQIECFILGKPNPAQLRSISYLVASRPDGGSHYEAAMTLGFILLVSCLGTVEAFPQSGPKVVHTFEGGWRCGLVNMRFDCLEDLFFWITDHQPL